MLSLTRRTLTIAALVSISLSSLPAWAQQAPQPREIEVIVDNRYTPNVIEATEGEVLRLRFVRRDYSPCSREVVFPSFNLRRMLATNVPMVIELPPLTVGEHPFQCWMNMLRGRIVVRPRPAATPAAVVDAGAPDARPSAPRAPATARLRPRK
jgi:plastocyanin domain-containing protein